MRAFLATKWLVRNLQRARREERVLVQHLKDRGCPNCDTVARMLAAMMARRSPLSGEEGLGRIRWALTLMLGCSPEIGEELIAVLIFRRQLVQIADPQGHVRWQILGPPAQC